MLTFIRWTRCSYNHTKRCFISNHDVVTWNVTFTGTPTPNITNTNVRMQTKQSSRTGKWKTWNNCTRTVSSIQCLIDERNQWRFLLRVIRKNTDGTLKYLMKEDEEHYGTGLKCHPNHEHGADFLRNFTIFNITDHSVGVSWSFEPWDVEKYHLEKVELTVRGPHGGKHTDRKIDLRDSTRIF